MLKNLKYFNKRKKQFIEIRVLNIVVQYVFTISPLFIFKLNF